MTYDVSASARRICWTAASPPPILFTEQKLPRRSLPKADEAGLIRRTKIGTVLLLRKMTNHFHYVYILVSESDNTRHYTGITNNLENRLKAHNAGQVPHTAEHRPWRIETAITFQDLKKAEAFERYLKSHSGRSFASKHF